jgi:hypothetical protein
LREFIIALRQLRFPIVLIAAAILVLQSLVAGLASAHAAARLAVGDAEAGVICHGNGGNGDDGGSAPAGPAAHDCCTFCTAAGPAALAPATAILARLGIARHADAATPSHDVRRSPRAIRAGPSQAPPIRS